MDRSRRAWLAGGAGAALLGSLPTGARAQRAAPVPAVGMAQALWVMITAMVIAVLTMMMFANAVGGFVERHPSVKVLALSFLLTLPFAKRR